MERLYTHEEHTKMKYRICWKSTETGFAGCGEANYSTPEDAWAIAEWTQGKSQGRLAKRPPLPLEYWVEAVTDDSGN